MTCDVSICSLVGNKYPDEHEGVNRRGGYRMEDNHHMRMHKDGVTVTIADGHGSIKDAAGKATGAYELSHFVSRAASNAIRGDVSEFYRKIQVSADMHMRKFMYSDIAMDENGRHYALLGNTIANYGCTLVRVSVSKDMLTCSNLGDSEAYLFRDSGETVALTECHDVSCAEEQARMREGGCTRIANYFHFPEENYCVQVSRAFGHFGCKHIIQQPFRSDTSVQKGDVVVAGSDGLWNCVTPARVLRALQEHKGQTAKQLCNVLVSLVRKCQRKKIDNVTIAVIRV